MNATMNAMWCVSFLLLNFLGLTTAAVTGRQLTRDQLDRLNAEVIKALADKITHEVAIKSAKIDRLMTDCEAKVNRTVDDCNICSASVANPNPVKTRKRKDVLSLIKKIVPLDHVLPISSPLLKHVEKLGKLGEKVIKKGKEVIKKIGKKVGKGVVKIGKKTLDQLKKVGKVGEKIGRGIGKGAKFLGKKILRGLKGIGRLGEKAGKSISRGIKKVGKGISRVGKKISRGFKNETGVTANSFLSPRSELFGRRKRQTACPSCDKVDINSLTAEEILFGVCGPVIRNTQDEVDKMNKPVIWINHGNQIITEVDFEKQNVDTSQMFTTGTVVISPFTVSYNVGTGPKSFKSHLRMNLFGIEKIAKRLSEEIFKHAFQI